MEISLDSIVSIFSLLLGGGCGAFFTWRYVLRKSKAEAEQAEAEADGAELNAAKELQEVYQQLINDVKTDRDEQKAYISELKDDRKHLREERDDLRRRQDELEESIRVLKRDVARNGRMVEAMRPFLCGRVGCPDRIAVAVSESGVVDEKPKRKKKKEDEQ